MHKGFRMMLEALGIHIDPVEIETLFQKLKQDLPALAQYFEKQFSTIDARLERIEILLTSSSQFNQQTVSVDQLLTPAELTLWEGEEIKYQEMRDLLIRRLVAQRRQKIKENDNGRENNRHKAVGVS